MARRCGCASETCACVVTSGTGIVVTGTGIPTNPYVVTSTQADVETGIDVQEEGSDVVRDVHGLDFRGSAVTVTPGPDKAVVSIVVPDPTTGIIIPTGTIWMFGMTVMPSGWLLCDGRTDLSVTTYANLFAAIGTNFGGDGVTTFGVPNMTDHMPIGISGTKPINGASNHGGSETKALQVGHLPPHVHPINHNHPAKNTTSDGSHDHELQLSMSEGSGPSMRKGGDNFNVQRTGIHFDGQHNHSIDLGNFVGNTSGTNGANATPFNIMPPWQALAFGIKT